ncbi:hypothetical protein [Arthrobacter sp. E3]|uniref:hypothetical protein n=1 Tax=Arthrobacter sp. E3 TaxID=517402 RepID=UPI001A950665|nr:hypothetical protein [Arthrobacter sp. E3]
MSDSPRLGTCNSGPTGSSERRIAVLLVDDHAAITMARALIPDVILMDLRMPVLDGVKATETICAGGLSKVLVLTTFDHDSY